MIFLRLAVFVRRRRHHRIIFPAKSGAVFLREFFRQCANVKNEWRQILALFFLTKENVSHLVRALWNVTDVYSTLQTLFLFSVACTKEEEEMCWIFQAKQVRAHSRLNMAHYCQNTLLFAVKKTVIKFQMCVSTLFVSVSVVVDNKLEVMNFYHLQHLWGSSAPVW